MASTRSYGSTTKPLAVFSSRDAVVLYDIRADRADVVSGTADGRAPRFRTPTLVTFIRQREPFDDAHVFGQDSLFEVDLATGAAVEIIRLGHHLLAFEWGPDGTQLAYLVGSSNTIDPSGPRDNQLCLFDTRSGTTRHIKSLSYTIGRGGHQRDERSITWSPDGAHLLVLDTVQQPTMYVVDLDGRNVIPPGIGTFARWLSDDRVLFQEDSQDTTKPWPWFVVSTETGQMRTFDLPDAAFRPAISPNGESIAFDNGKKTPSVFVFDVESGVIRMLARGYVAPVWLRPNLIAASAAGPCPRTNFCVMPWLETNGTIGIDPVTGDQGALKLPTTFNASGYVTQGVLDIVRPATGP